MLTPLFQVLIFNANHPRLEDPRIRKALSLAIDRDHAQTGNYHFQNNSASSTYPMADRARAALALARVPVVCLSGHVHWNTVASVDGITHLTQQPLTESSTTGGEAARALGVIELGDTVRWEVKGENPFAFAFRPATRRWTPPLPDFAAHPELRPPRLAQAAE